MKSIILDTHTDCAECDFCGQWINPAKPRVIIGLVKNQLQWFKFYHWECAEATFDPDHELKDETRHPEDVYNDENPPPG